MRDQLLDTDHVGRTRFGRHLPLPAVHPADYARGHALFEARSDQRQRVVGWLDAKLARHPRDAALSVLSVGCGAGEVDATLATGVAHRAAPGVALRWLGIDPHAPSAAACAAAVSQAVPAAHVRQQACTFADLDCAETFDVVTFVHSMYYVPDIPAALNHAVSLLAPEGRLLVLHAPLGALNQLAAELAPETGGHPQWWAETVLAALAPLEVDVEIDQLDAEVDLTGCDTADHALLDFTVQAQLNDEVRPAVLAALRAVARPGAGLRLPHPVLALTVHPR